MALLTLQLINANIPLSQWKRQTAIATAELRSKRHDTSGETFTYSTDKQLANVINIIVNAMSHPDAVELVAREWDQFPSVLRAPLTIALNEMGRDRSHNKSKGILRLDKMLDGKVLRKVDDRQTERDLREEDGKVVSRQRPVNPAVAGAVRAHSPFALPPHYHKMTSAEKKRVQQQFAAERRSR